MTRHRVAFAFVIGIAAAALVFAQDRPQRERPDDEKKAAAELPKCPVMKRQTANLAVRGMTEAGPVYFCCPRCKGRFDAEPAKFTAAAAEQEKVLKKVPRVQIACPVSGEPTKDVTTEHDGAKVSFCCAGCKEKFEKEPAKYAAKLAASYTYQTHCPVMGEEIDPAVSLDLGEGRKIYFCCESCIEKFKKEPGKYAEKLAAQGYKYDEETLAKAKSSGD